MKIRATVSSTNSLEINSEKFVLLTLINLKFPNLIFYVKFKKSQIKSKHNQR